MSTVTTVPAAEATGKPYATTIHRCGRPEPASGRLSLAQGTAGLAPTPLPWLLGLGIAGLIAIALWIGHRVVHAGRTRELATA